MNIAAEFDIFELALMRCWLSAPDGHFGGLMRASDGPVDYDFRGRRPPPAPRVHGLR